MKQTEERYSESRMREIRKSGSMRGSNGAAPPHVVLYSTETSTCSGDRPDVSVTYDCPGRQHAQSNGLANTTAL